MSDRRAAELASRLAAVEQRIVRACEHAGRRRRDITLIAVSKTWPPADVLRLASLGVRDFGESYDREAAGKAAALTSAGVELRWHFVGQLQRNKTRSVAGYATAVHSVDRPALVEALSAAASRVGREIDVFVQVSLDDPEARRERAGAPASEVLGLADDVAARDGLRLAGVMGVAPMPGHSDRTAPPEVAFARLHRVSEQLQRRHPTASAVSAGMSHDLEAAISHGATHVRVGSALFGDRPPGSV